MQTGQLIKEIPGAFATQEGDDPQIILLPEGQYQLYGRGITPEMYAIGVVQGITNSVVMRVITGTTTVGQSYQYTIELPSESSSLIALKAEQFDQQIEGSGRAWVTQTKLTGYTGTAYLSALPDTGKIFTTTANSPELRYTINFSSTGTYYVWLRGYAPNAAGDSLYFGLNNQPVTILTGFALVLFGGSDEQDAVLEQTWVNDGSDWLNLNPPTAPPARTYPSMVAAENTIYLFGGNDGENYYHDLWQYTNGNWQEMSIDEGASTPSARTLTALAYDASHARLLLFGGQSITGTALADIWTFDLVGDKWLELRATPDVAWPAARWGHTLTYDIDTQQLWLVGGTADDETFMTDGWTYQDSWQKVGDLSVQAYHQVIYDFTNHALLFFGNEQTGWLR